MNSKHTGIGSIALLAFFIASCGGGDKGKPQAAAPPPVSVSLYTVNTERVTGIDTYPGTVVPLKEVEIRAEVNGYITGIFVQDGQPVKKGQRLYEIDRSRYAAAQDQARAQVQIARANLQRVTKDLERYTRLAQQDAIAKQRVDYAQADQQTAQSQLAAAEAVLSNVSTDLSRSVITAPMDGIIGIASVRQGALVVAGSTLINTISAPNPIAVDLAVGEQEISRFNRLSGSLTATKDSLFTLLLPNQQLYTYPGSLSTIDRAVDPLTGTIKVRLSFSNPQQQLRAGMSCIVRVVNQDAGELVTIPTRAMVEQLGEFYVYVANDSNKVSQRRVVPGTPIAGKIVIREGLQSGERIVSDGVQNLREGAAINPGAPAAGH